MQQDLISAIETIEAEALKIVTAAEQEAQALEKRTRRELADRREAAADQRADRRREAEELRNAQREQILQSARNEAEAEGEKLKSETMPRFDQAVKHLVERSLQIDGRR